MNDTSCRYRSPRAGVPHALWAALQLWWRTWRAARAAEEAYLAARAKGAPRDIAAENAFEALTGVKSYPERAGLPANRQPPSRGAPACDDPEPGTGTPGAPGGAV